MQTKVSSLIQTILSAPETHRINLSARGLYRRSGIAPCPEEYLIFHRYYTAMRGRVQPHICRKHHLLLVGDAALLVDDLNPGRSGCHPELPAITVFEDGAAIQTVT